MATDLGKLARDRWLAVADINDRGQVVGGSRIQDGGSRGFVWQNGRMTRLGRGGAQAINERGQIIGTGRQHAVLWEKGRMIDLGGQRFSGATAINERGQILGYRYPPGRSVIWQSGKMRELGLNAWWPDWYVAVTPINNRGQVVGYSGDRAVLWQNGRITTLGSGWAIDINDRGDVLGRSGWGPEERVILWRNGAEIDLGPGWPVAINERGQVTGVTRTPAGEWGFAFLWQNGTTTDLGTLGGSRSFPTAISNRGQVVGWSLDKSGLQRAFLWQSGTMIELHSPKGTTGPDASRTRAVAINEHNQIIGDNCFWDCGGLRGGRYRSKFAVIWTLRRP